MKARFTFDEEEESRAEFQGKLFEILEKAGATPVDLPLECQGCTVDCGVLCEQR